MSSPSAPVAKVLLLGDANVGKTSLRSQFIHHRFSSAYRATVGGDFLTAKVPTSFAPRRLPQEQRQINSSGNISSTSNYNSNSNYSNYDHDYINHNPLQRPSFSQSAEPETVSMQVWDTAGQERFDSLVRSFFRGTDVAILVYDVTDAASFSHLRKWLDDFIAHAFVRNPIVVVVGNKIDRGQYRTVSERQAKAFAQEAAEAYRLMAPSTSFNQNPHQNNQNSQNNQNPNSSFSQNSPNFNQNSGLYIPSPSFSSNMPNYYKSSSQNQYSDGNESIFETPRSPSAMGLKLQRNSYSQIPTLSLNNNNNNSNNTNPNNTTDPLDNPAIQCFEVSAKDNIDVDKLFTYIADRIVAARKDIILDFDAVDAYSVTGSLRGGFSSFGGGGSSSGNAYGGIDCIDVGNSLNEGKRNNRSAFGFCC